MTELERQVRPRNLAVSEDILDEGIHAARAGGDAAKVLFAFARDLVCELGREDLGKALHGTQGRPHVVGNTIRKCFQFGDGFLERGGADGDILFQGVGMFPELGLGFLQSGFGRFTFRDIGANGDVLDRFAIFAQIRDDRGVDPIKTPFLALFLISPFQTRPRPMVCQMLRINSFG